MNKICSYLDIARVGSVKDDGGGGIVVEECASYDSVLADFLVICKNENIEGAKIWIADNCRKVGNHANKSIDRGKGAFAFSLVKTALRISSYTEEFVNECGSLQGFLDKWGNENPILLKSNEATEVQSPNDMVFREAEQQDNEGGYDDFDDETENFLGLSFTMTEPKDRTDFPEDECVDDEVNSEDTVEVSSEDNVEDSNDNMGNMPAIESIERSKENFSEESFSDDLQEDDEEEHCDTEEDIFTPKGQVIEKPEGISIPFLLNTGKNTMVPYKDLMNMAVFIRKAAEELELDDVSETEILRPEDKMETLSYLNEFAPSLIKRFFLSYIQDAESDIDYVRVTKMLDKFCSFVENDESGKMEVGYE